MTSKHDPTKRKKLPLSVAVKPNRGLAPLGSYATTARLFKTDLKIWLNKGLRGIICEDTEVRCKKGDVAFRMPGSKTYYCVPLKFLEIERPKQ